MKREKQIDLLEAAETRTRGYLRNWLSNPKFKDAVRRQNRPTTNGDEGTHYVARVKKHACA